MVLEVGLARREATTMSVFFKYIVNVVLEVGLDSKNESAFFKHIVNVVLEVGLEPTKPEGERFTVSCHCH